MLTAAGVDFELVESPLDEEKEKRDWPSLSPVLLAERLALAKARAASAGPDDLVLGSDQTLERADGTMLSKPGSRTEARDQLLSLSGSRHFLHSAAVILEKGAAVWSATETVCLWVRPLSERFLEAYLDEEFEQVRWSVGGYRIEGPGVQLFDKIEGSHFAILGMPLLPLMAFLRERGLMAN